MQFGQGCVGFGQGRTWLWEAGLAQQVRQTSQQWEEEDGEDQLRMAGTVEQQDNGGLPVTLLELIKRNFISLNGFYYCLSLFLSFSALD